MSTKPSRLNPAGMQLRWRTSSIATQSPSVFMKKNAMPA
jgi:hypothetical protein